MMPTVNTVIAILARNGSLKTRFYVPRATFSAFSFKNFETSQIVCNSSHNTSARFSELQSTCPWEHFEEKSFRVFNFLNVYGLSAKKIGTFVKIAFDVARRTFENIFQLLTQLANIR